MKRVVTGHDEAGRSVFRSVGEFESTVVTPVVDWFEAWSTYRDDEIPIDASDESSRDRYSERHPVFPRTGESCFRILDFHPMEFPPDPEELAGLASSLPGLVEHMEPEDFGMHTTDSVDYGVILSGAITLELDDGRTERLEAGDVFVQNGTRHAWRVDEPCRMAVVLTGIPRRHSGAEA